MFRLVHTADWQMGMMARGFGDVAAQLRAARLKSLVNLLAVAAEREVEAILVAGDQFEHNQVSDTIVEQVVGVLNDQTRIPIYMIPGNHDPYTRDSVYRRPIWSQLRDHIHVLTSREAIELSETATLYPCPLDRKNGMEDPASWIPTQGEDSLRRRDSGGRDFRGRGVRIGLAHGNMRIREDIGDGDFPIALDTCAVRGLDYLALGHWHSTMPDPSVDASAGAFYSGTHETTRFGERDSGNVLVVGLDGPGQAPQVEVVRTGVLNWREIHVDLGQQLLGEAARMLRELPDPMQTLLRLTLSGETRPDETSGQNELMTMLEQRFLHHRVDGSALRSPSFEHSMSEWSKLPYVVQTATELQAIASGERINDGDRENVSDPIVARRALQMLQDVLWTHRDR